MDENVNPYVAPQTELSATEIEPVQRSGFAVFAWLFFILSFIVFFIIDYQFLLQQERPYIDKTGIPTEIANFVTLLFVAITLFLLWKSTAHRKSLLLRLIIVGIHAFGLFSILAIIIGIYLAFFVGLAT